MNGVLGLVCAHIGYTGRPGEPPEHGEMNTKGELLYREKPKASIYLLYKK